MNLSLSTVESVLAAARGSCEAVMVFGSAARGDATSQSDIDVLQLLERRAPPYKVGAINVSVYDDETLTQMAVQGSLFVLHLRTEGVILADAQGRLKACLKRYQAPDSYEPYRKALRLVTNLLDVNQDDYHRRWRQFNESALFLLRTALYIEAAEQGKPTFSVAAIASRMTKPDLFSIFQLKHAVSPDWAQFRRARVSAETHLNTKSRNPYGSLEALITNSAGQSSLVVAFGLRILAGQSLELTYELFASSNAVS